MDIPLYAWSIPLFFLFLTSSLLYEAGDYDQILSSAELAVNTHVLADNLVNSALVESQQIVEEEVKFWPNLIREDLSLDEISVPEGYDIRVTIGNRTLISKGDFSGDVYSVTRLVSYQGEPTILRVSLSN